VRVAFHSPRASYLKSYETGDTANVRNFVGGLERLGHEVRIVSHLNVRRLWQRRVPVWRMALEALRVWREMQRFAPDAWLVYAPSTTDPDLLGWWQCRRRKYVLVTARGGMGHRLSPLWRRVFALAHRASVRRADGITADRPCFIAELRDLGVAEQRLHLLPSPAGEFEHLPTRSEARARLGLPSDAPIVLCVTRLPPLESGRKTERVIDLVGCFSKLPEPCRLVIVGGGEGQIHVQRTIRAHSLGNRVHTAGRVARDEVKWFYAACDFYAYPFPEERPFVAIVEAQAAGRPVVVMRSPATETIVLDQQTGLMADDLQQFTDYMASLATNRQRCAAMGEAAREYIAAYHSSETRVKQIEALLTGTRPLDRHARPLKASHAAP
jgi:glycosyltransferase involved in cell wall biosynthesis